MAYSIYCHTHIYIDKTKVKVSISKWKTIVKRSTFAFSGQLLRLDARCQNSKIVQKFVDWLVSGYNIPYNKLMLRELKTQNEIDKKTKKVS